jgi:hypothetical protein
MIGKGTLVIITPIFLPFFPLRTGDSASPENCLQWTLRSQGRIKTFRSRYKNLDSNCRSKKTVIWRVRPLVATGHGFVPHKLW